MPVTGDVIGTATIAAAGSLSDAVDVSGARSVGLLVPTATSAALTFQGSADGVTFRNVYTIAAAELTVTVSVHDRAYCLPTELAAFNFIKVRSGTAGAPVTQAGGLIIAVTYGP